MLHDITASDEIPHAFSHCIYAGALWLCLKFVYKSRLGDFTTWETSMSSLGVENLCTFLMGNISQATPKVIKKMIVSTKMSYVRWCEPAQVPIVTPNCCPFMDPWRHTWTIRQENCPFLPKSMFDVEDVNTGDWRETEWWINCKAILCKKLQPGTFFDF